jgi:hypothetical protein
VLSHSAVLKMRDQGNFYHLLAENPNAAEWSTFWLRYLKVKNDLVGIRGGMQRITEVLHARLSDHIFVQHKLLDVSRGRDGITLTFDTPNGVQRVVVRKHLILALPKGPMVSLVARNPQFFRSDMTEALDSVTALPLLKLFVIVAEKWWDGDDAVLTNRYAQNFPTRECHTLSSSVPKSTRGAVMIYTEPPASNFWTNYITKRGGQDAPERGTVKENPRLVHKLLNYLRDLYPRDVEPEEVSYAIRDWGRAPYDGAVHIWRPMRRSWEILRSLSALAPPPGFAGDGPVTHVCGEAYSDYNGFIEGSLRSTMHVLHVMNKEFETPTPWLCDPSTCRHGDRQSPRLKARYAQSVWARAGSKRRAGNRRKFSIALIDPVAGDVVASSVDDVKEVAGGIDRSESGAAAAAKW